jgi:ABC-type antimicrobial peptide transport system permease subunit
MATRSHSALSEHRTIRSRSEKAHSIPLSGVYGTVGYIVVQRTQEIGIRAALGADGRSVLLLILRDGMQPIAIGVVAGFLVAVGVSQVLSSMLFGLNPLDAISFGESLCCWLASHLSPAMFPRAVRCGSIRWWC